MTGLQYDLLILRRALEMEEGCFLTKAQAEQAAKDLGSLRKSYYLVLDPGLPDGSKSLRQAAIEYLRLALDDMKGAKAAEYLQRLPPYDAERVERAAARCVRLALFEPIRAVVSEVEPQQEDELLRPQLDGLRKLLQTYFPMLYVQVLEPTLADLRQEHSAALTEGRPLKARCILLRGCCALAAAAVCQLGSSLLGRIAAFWQATSTK